MRAVQSIYTACVGNQTWTRIPAAPPRGRILFALSIVFFWRPPRNTVLPYASYRVGLPILGFSIFTLILATMQGLYIKEHSQLSSSSILSQPWTKIVKALDEYQDRVASWGTFSRCGFNISSIQVDRLGLRPSPICDKIICQAELHRAQKSLRLISFNVIYDELPVILIIMTSFSKSFLLRKESP